MSVFSKIKARVRTARIKAKLIATSVLLATAGAAAVATVNTASAITVTTNKYDCTDNSVVAGGASGVSALQTKYAKGATCTQSNGKPLTEAAYHIQDVYHGFGISSSDISAMSSDSVNGYVTKTGDVYIGTPSNGTLVATNAYTAGLTGPTSEQHKYGATDYYVRPPSESFEDDALSAMVIMKGGVFQHALLNACGNPVNATPKKPSYSITKQVSSGGSYANSVNVKSGASVTYKISVSSTGPVPVDNVLVRDALPTKNLTVNKNSLQENGKAVSAAEITAFFDKGYTIPTIKNGDTVTFTFSASKAGNAAYDDSSCVAETINNTAYISTSGLGGESSTATVKTSCATPELACVSLVPAVVSSANPTTGDKTYTFTATASETRIPSLTYTFNYGDGSKNDVITSSTTSVTTKTPHNFAPGSHEVTVTVSGQGISSKPCSYNFSITPPAQGTLTCEDLSSKQGATNPTTNATEFTFTTTASASTNAKITGYAYSLDAAKAVAGNASTSYNLAPGKHTVQVTVNGTDLTTNKAISATSAKCVATVTAPTPTTPKPSYSIQKQVASSANGPFEDNLTGVPSGSTVYYKIVVQNTSDTPIANVTVNDKPQTDVHYVANTLEEDAQAANATAFFGTGITIASIPDNGTVTFTYTATVGNTTTDTDASCNPETVTNTGYMTTTTTGLTPQQSTAGVTTTCQTKPLPGTLACTGLTVVPGDTNADGSQMISFAGTATATNAAITSYTFTVTDSTGKVIATLPGTLTNSGQNGTSSAQSLPQGNYQVVLAVAGTDNSNNPITAPANTTCAKQFTVPIYTFSCDTFNLATDNATRSVTVSDFKVSSTYPNAAVSQVTINWGDGESSTPSTPAAVIGTPHTFSVNSSTVTATATFTTPDNTTVGNVTCSQPVSFTAPPTQPPAALPNTGAGDTIGIFIGVVVAATIGFRVYTVRKLRRY